MTLNLKRSIERSLPIRFLYWLLILNFVDLSSFLVRQRRQISKRKRVLFVKMDGIGDYFIWTSIFKSIEKIYPSSEYERVLAAPASWKGLVENSRVFDQVILIDPRKFILRPFYRFSFLKKIRLLCSDIAVHTKLSRDFVWGDSIIRCSGAKERIGTRGIANRM